jgi:hypothetical protein
MKTDENPMAATGHSERSEASNIVPARGHAAGSFSRQGGIRMTVFPIYPYESVKSVVK